MDYAGFWIRFVAYIIDYVVMMIFQFIVFAIVGVSAFGATSLDPAAGDVFATTVGVIAYLVIVLAGVAYFVIMESSSKQATIGKMALGLIVTDENGGRITWLRALGRYFAKILSALIMLIGYIMIGFTEEKTGLHDIICTTRVVKGKPGEVGVDLSVFE
ncbi:MAG: RDD family protein [Pseudomonadota bacterium]